MTNRLALLGGSKSIKSDPENLFTWPIIADEDETAVLDVLRKGAMSFTDVTQQFEQEFKSWLGTEFALGYNNGTASVLGALYGCGVGVGDEVICPSITYWAAAAPVFALGGTVVFADVDPMTATIDPNDIERCIGERTKAIMVVHLMGHPADMDPIMEIAAKHQLKVIEDASQAHGALYKGRKVGTIGHVAAFSMMSTKALVSGEGGVLATNDRVIYDRAIALGHYERFNIKTVIEELKPFAGLPLGGYKHRMNQISAALARVQLLHFDERAAVIRKSMNYFWDLLKDVPGIQAHRVNEQDNCTMGGWHWPHGFYRSDELGGLSINRFTEAIRAEGFNGCWAGCSRPLHAHGLFQTCDVYGHGRPTRIAHATRDVRLLDLKLPVSETINARMFNIPSFKQFRPELIEEFAEAYRKVALNHVELLKNDKIQEGPLGGWSAIRHA